MWCFREHRGSLSESLKTMKTFKYKSNLIDFIKLRYDSPTYELYYNGVDGRILADHLHLISVNNCGCAWFWESRIFESKESIIDYWESQK